MIVRLCGGLGNAFFQYAFGRSLQARQRKVQFLWQDEREGYALGPYNLNVDLVSSLYGPFSTYKDKAFVFDASVYDASPDIFLDGYWQSEKYFESISDEIRKELTLTMVSDEVSRTADRLREGNSVFLHVRRGDYLNPWTAQYHGNLGMDYYNKAIEYIKERVADVQVFVFSDDPGWCKGMLPCEVISGRFNRYEDLYLLSQTRHAIIANSTYSWWGAWLGERSDSIVVAPQRWFGTAPLDVSDVIPSRWVKL